LKQKEEESKKIADKQKKLQAKKTKSEQDKENKEIEKRQKAEEKYKLWLEGKDALLFAAPEDPQSSVDPGRRSVGP